jgi:hypothetical protein
MADRRSLVEGLKTEPPPPRQAEQAFVYGAAPAAAKPPGEGARPSLANASRVPLTTRVRVELASALKRASLERQLAGQHPNSLQDIVEEALEPWLRTNGYLG